MERNPDCFCNSSEVSLIDLRLQREAYSEDLLGKYYGT
jgi:hypothetical protein